MRAQVQLELICQVNCVGIDHSVISHQDLHVSLLCAYNVADGGFAIDEDTMRIHERTTEAIRCASGPVPSACPMFITEGPKLVPTIGYHRAALALIAGNTLDVTTDFAFELHKLLLINGHLDMVQHLHQQVAATRAAFRHGVATINGGVLEHLSDDVDIDLRQHFYPQLRDWRGLNGREQIDFLEWLMRDKTYASAYEGRFDKHGMHDDRKRSLCLADMERAEGVHFVVLQQEPYSTLPYRTLPSSTLLCSAIPCSTLPCAMQHSLMQHSAM